MQIASLADLAKLINTQLAHCARQTPTAYSNPGAFVEGRRVHVWTHSYYPTTKLTKAEAHAYLTDLGKGR